MVDIPNAFIQTRVQHQMDMNVINIRRLLVYILLEIAPDIYDTSVTTYRKGIKQLVVQCQNSIYVTIMVSLMNYQKFRESMELEGYEFNPTSHELPTRLSRRRKLQYAFMSTIANLATRYPKWLEKH